MERQREFFAGTLWAKSMTMQKPTFQWKPWVHVCKTMEDLIQFLGQDGSVAAHPSEAKAGGDLAWKVSFGGTLAIAFVQSKIMLSTPSGSKENFLKDAKIKTNPLSQRKEFEKKLEETKKSKSKSKSKLTTEYSNHLKSLDSLEEVMHSKFNYHSGCLRLVIVASRTDFFQGKKWEMEGKDLIVYLSSNDLERISPDPTAWKETWEKLIKNKRKGGQEENKRKDYFKNPEISLD